MSAKVSLQAYLVIKYTEYAIDQISFLGTNAKILLMLILINPITIKNTQC